MCNNSDIWIDHFLLKHYISQKNIVAETSEMIGPCGLSDAVDKMEFQDIYLCIS